MPGCSKFAVLQMYAHVIWRHSMKEHLLKYSKFYIIVVILSGPVKNFTINIDMCDWRDNSYSDLISSQYRETLHSGEGHGSY